MSSELFAALRLTWPLMKFTLTRSVGRCSALTKASIRILIATLLIGVLPGVSATCYIDTYVMDPDARVLSPLTSLLTLSSRSASLALVASNTATD